MVRGNQDMKKGSLWIAAEGMGIALAIFGISMGLYASYVTWSPNQMLAQQSPTPFSSIPYVNQTLMLQRVHYVLVGVGSLGALMIGILLLLLGLVTYKYAKLRLNSKSPSGK
jgi:hypothetical protein